MLVLSRAVGEAVLIGGLKVVTVEKVGPDFVEIRITELARDPNPPVWLSLHNNQFVEIMPDVQVGLLHLRTDSPRARLGFVLPREVPIHRKEIWDSIHGS
jgi:sRNA-binding carbon storage regulator CsrA